MLAGSGGRQRLRQGGRGRMTVHDKDTFLEYRREQERRHLERSDGNDPMSSLLTVEVNTTELCNRRCVFCPRHDASVYPNRNLHMSVAVAEVIGDRLAEVDYRGKLSFSGFGENLLNRNFPDLVAAMKRRIPHGLFECNTNGDFLDADSARRLFDAGLDRLYINLYDGAEQIGKFERIMAGFAPGSYHYRAHYSLDDHGLHLNNRAGNVTWLGMEGSALESLRGKPCHYPFYKMFVDWNADVLFCSNDWGREIVVGNLLEHCVPQVWLGEPLNAIRRRLMVGDRSHKPCAGCSVDGRLFGRDSFERLRRHLT